NIFRPYYRWIRLIFKLNLIKTFYINFRTQSFKKAIKLPIFVYGKLKIYSLKGQIIIDAPIQTGMIHIGKDLDHNPVSFNPIKMTINGILRFKGHALISGGSTVTVWNGVINLAKNVSIGSGVQLKAYLKIEIGENSQIVALCTIMDTNVHYVKNIKTGEILKSFAPIIIGKNCWLNQGSIVTKGTIIPDYCIVARNTFLNKDYSKNCEQHSLFAGSPAKVLATDVQRIFDFDEETKLNKYFKENKDLNSIEVEKDLFEEPDAIPHILKIF
ncbi:acyltransferase, partial [bacterium]|nr:acyltransferase [bacterium]